MKVIIAEKPSVGKNIADAVKAKTRADGYIESDEYLITWAFGHLLQLYDAKDYNKAMEKWQLDNFPFIPSDFKYKIKSDPKNKDRVDAGVKKQLNIIKSLIDRKEVKSIVLATDFDREGQIIGDSIINYLEVKKPVERLLLNEWTQAEVLKGLSSLKPNTDMKPVSDAGFSRQLSDWTIGINLTSVASLKYKKNTKGPLNIGRVLLPTLKIIYDRDMEIENFVKVSYFKLTSTFGLSNGKTYDGSYYEGNEDKFKTRDELKDVAAKIKGKSGNVTKKEIQRKKEYPGYLFNLTNLQGHITSKYKGWTSDKVLKVAQSLYEKKFITYPRTASQVLEESLVSKAENVLNVLKKGLSYEKDITFSKLSRVFDNKKVEGHSAIIPTYVIPSGLSKDEEIVYKEIKDRFIMQFMPVAELDETIIHTEFTGLKGLFITKGKILVVEGWKKVQGVDTKEVLLPEIKLKDIVKVNNTKISNHETKPPAHHTEKTLLRVMEACGKSFQDEEDSEELMDAILTGFSIGTPATRAETINKLLYAGYVEVKGKSLICSNLGKSLVRAFPVKELFDLEYTGRLEKTLSDMEKGKVERDDFLKFIFDFVESSVKEIKVKGGGTLSTEERDVLGKCPACGSDVVESPKAFGCSNYRDGCKFAVWKDDKFLNGMQKTPDAKMVKALLKDGNVLVKGLISKKKGTAFDAILSYHKNADNDYYSWDMKFPERK